ncbi:ABC transporter permease [Siansivirga zeaxanthinifaciens]|uniref:Membrane protein n=1 Tax=Siansivirga zeaxanthinifaciens CC-SAMT-1 TaxID=1454006 RepID=A0A0C5VVC4_9FLAO|nr:FtsX-like permease family protein [Siansivirga zeaxanthinifaciens]AJR03081.1 membrane protein [Siansivirga zeaxanthinifaciens CC-SAMT-1]
MNFPLYIAKRYLRSKSSNNAINFITIIAVVGIILGAASLFIVLSGFAGLKAFTLEFSSQVDPDLKAESTVGKTFEISATEIEQLKKIKGIAHFSKTLEERVLIASNNKNTLAILKGVDGAYQNVVAIDSIIDTGIWLEQNAKQIVVGWGVSNNLSLGILDFTKPINIYVPKPGKGQITSTKNAFNTVDAINVGVFYINEKLNDSYVFSSIDLAQNLLNYQPNQISAIEFKIKEDAILEDVKNDISKILGNKVVLKNREQLNDALYKMLNTENLAVYLIFTLVLIIAFFNVIGSLIMMMLDKKRSLNTLYNIGATVKDIRSIFFYQGSLMSVVGGFIGLILALLITLLQKWFNLVMITPTLPYPVIIKFENIIIVFITISVLGIMASKIASVRITKSLVETH